jgi:putative flavoprotein involved in K+ transport
LRRLNAIPRGAIMNAATKAAVPVVTGRVLGYDTVVIGGGQAGLAVGHHLAKHDVDFVILDANRRVGDSWRNRWDSLRLFTPARYCGLPGMSFPESPGHFPDKDQVADYLERYAERFELPVRSNTRVTQVRGVGNDFVVQTGHGAYRARNVVVATGPFQRPRLPTMAARLAPEIHQLHSHEYRNPFDLPEGDVLIVGAGNSGAQIALELSRFRDVTLAGRDVGRLPRRILGLDVFRWLWPVFRRLNLGTWLGRKLHARTKANDPLIGIRPKDFISHGVRRVGRVTDVREGRPRVSGMPVKVRVVIWATGFTPDFSWIALPTMGSEGAPAHWRGVTNTPGLYFVGLSYLYRKSSALLGGVAADAEFIASHIAGRG